jgi:hypothetical protein
MRKKLIAAENLRGSSVVKRLVDGSKVMMEACGDVMTKMKTFDENFRSFENCHLLNRSVSEVQPLW